MAELKERHLLLYDLEGWITQCYTATQSSVMNNSKVTQRGPKPKTIVKAKNLSCLPAFREEIQILKQPKKI